MTFRHTSPDFVRFIECCGDCGQGDRQCTCPGLCYAPAPAEAAGGLEELGERLARSRIRRAMVLLGIALASILAGLAVQR